MEQMTEASRSRRDQIDAHRSELEEILRRYRAADPRLFGSLARGEATEESDVDVLVDLEPDAGNELLRVSGIAEEFSIVLGAPVDVVTSSLLRDRVSATAIDDAVRL
jgi:uncharacterized protein